MEPLQFNRFYPYAELTEQLNALAAKRPDLMTVQSIGKSFEGRDIWLATITNSATGAAEDKPAFWIDANIHATELSASAAALYFINKLLNEYGQNADITRCLDTRVYYIVPRVNPDGAELYFADNPRFVRSSVRPWPYDEEGLEGLTLQDIDGDGRILTMRIPDPNGPWKIHPEQPRLLTQRDPTETGGQYYRLMPEGLIKDWDGVTFGMKHEKEGLDLNRNFPESWRMEHEQYGAGPYPTSEPEARALVAFIVNHPNITGSASFHTFGGLLLRPYSTAADDTMAAEDLWTYKAIGSKATAVTGYPNISVWHDFRYHPKETITGDFDQWMFDHRGVFSWTVEIWSPQRQAGITDYKYIDWYREHPFEDDVKMLQWNDEVLQGEGYVTWYPYNHPQLGPVEIGGWDPQYCFRNPPPYLLEKEVSIFPEWLLWQTLISPLLELNRFEATALGGNTYKLRLVVDNTGWLPSYVTKKALDRKIVRPVIAELTLPEGAELVTGKVREEIGQLEGRAYKSSAGFGWSADPSEERAKVEWVVRAQPGATISVVARHERAGAVRASVTLSDDGEYVDA